MRHRLSSVIAFSIGVITLLLLMPNLSVAQKSHSRANISFTSEPTRGRPVKASMLTASTRPPVRRPRWDWWRDREPVVPRHRPSRRFLYAANEISDYHGKKSGAVSAFAIDRKSGKLTFLNELPSGGAGPCYVSLDKTGKHVIVANYDSGSVAVFPVLAGGKLGQPSSVIQHTGHGPDPKRQEGPHAHQIEPLRTTALRWQRISALMKCWYTASTRRRARWLRTTRLSQKSRRARDRDTSFSIPTRNFFT